MLLIYFIFESCVYQNENLKWDCDVIDRMSVTFFDTLPPELLKKIYTYAPTTFPVYITVHGCRNPGIKVSVLYYETICDVLSRFYGVEFRGTKDYHVYFEGKELTMDSSVDALSGKVSRKNALVVYERYKYKWATDDNWGQGVSG